MEDKIIDMLINYHNKNNLSWLKVYEDVLKKLNLEDRINDTKLLNSIIKLISKKGYDIIPNPFKLEKYRWSLLDKIFLFGFFILNIIVIKYTQ